MAHPIEVGPTSYEILAFGL